MSRRRKPHQPRRRPNLANLGLVLSHDRNGDGFARVVNGSDPHAALEYIGKMKPGRYIQPSSPPSRIQRRGGSRPSQQGFVFYRVTGSIERLLELVQIYIRDYLCKAYKVSQQGRRGPIFLTT